MKKKFLKNKKVEKTDRHDGKIYIAQMRKYVCL